VPRPAIPDDARVSIHRHRVPFFETDAMGVVHHANYVRYLELGRVAWMDQYDEPYRTYVEKDLHFAVTRVDLRCVRSARFDDELDVCTWLEWVKGASLRMAYVVLLGEELIASGATEHAMVDSTGRVRRLPPEIRARLSKSQAQRSS
jgi:acyl-CoA thioester hydrolase